MGVAKLRELLPGGQLRVSLGQAEGPAHQHREDYGEEGDCDEVFHDTSLLSIDGVFMIIKRDY